MGHILRLSERLFFLIQVTEKPAENWLLFFGAPRRRVSPAEEVPPRELSIDPVADERLGQATGRAEAS
jgi:hypothetical protein